MSHSPNEREIRKQFFAYRNGMLADALRGAGNCHTVIFGLTLQQVIEIAKSFEKDAELANDLWQDSRCREARMIAPLLMPFDSMLKDVAVAWCDGVEDCEICDVLCHRLLRYLPFADYLVENYIESHAPLYRYLAFRLLMNLIAIGRPIDGAMASAKVAEALLDDDAAVRHLAQMIADTLG